MSRISSLLRLYNTIRHLKLVQIHHQMWYRVKSLMASVPTLQTHEGDSGFDLSSMVFWDKQYVGAGKFRFINIQHDFEDSIDWNFSKYGKLWTYNLNYFDWLHQDALDKDIGLAHITDYAAKYSTMKDGLEPYPTSLRLINWTKFLSQHRIKDNRIDSIVLTDAKRLSANLEYHLLANHLLENAFALTFAGTYLRNPAILKKGIELLVSQLKEQTLDDGAHYELSPMYHRLMLYRVLDTINLVASHRSLFSSEVESDLKDVGSKMLGWACKMRFLNGDLPRFGDTAADVNPSLDSLLGYATSLAVHPKTTALSESGYRKMEGDGMELLIKASNIMPTYQPGHTHADSLSFVLHSQRQPAIVDTGISTYDNNSRRRYERSTAAHNTVTVMDQNSSDVWSAFRIGRRAGVKVLEDVKDQRLRVEHDGYRNIGTRHRRSFDLNGRILTVVDDLQGAKTDGTAYLHIHPSVEIVGQSSTGVRTNLIDVSVNPPAKIKIEEYMYAESYNTLTPSKRLVIHFSNQLVTTIKAKSA